MIHRRYEYDFFFFKKRIQLVIFLYLRGSRVKCYYVFGFYEMGRVVKRGVSGIACFRLECSGIIF